MFVTVEIMFIKRYGRAILIICVEYYLMRKIHGPCFDRAINLTLSKVRNVLFKGDSTIIRNNNMISGYVSPVLHEELILI